MARPRRNKGKTKSFLALRPACLYHVTHSGQKGSVKTIGVHAMNLLTTLHGSMMEGFLPAGWDLDKIDRLADLAGEKLVERRAWWHPRFQPVACASLADFDTYMGHEIALA